MSRKSILFIAPAFFGYEISITNALIENGYDVDFFDERTSNNSFLKAIFRVKKSLLNSAINKYYKNILTKIQQKQYAYFFLIKGEVVPVWFIVEFKKLNPQSKLIYYTYDSFNNNNANSLYILKHFDSCYSFDFEDVKLNPVFKLKHLFYTGEFINNLNKQDKKYSISFVGTLHSSRYKTIKHLFNNIDKTFAFFYSPAKWFFLLEKIIKGKHANVKWHEVSFEKLSRQQVAEIFKSSKSVLDIQRSGQTGLTMRTFEVLAAGATLITTNTHIKEAAFYDPAYIMVLDDLNDTEIIGIKERIDKLDAKMEPIFNELNEFYINNWVKEFINQ
ncbi:glycosyltransferase [Mucilaginibacter sp.]|uniref:glycosyltransferase n=1 Tax=Mucilaginibacter sp. TaxID=1882438 RepID=UPI0025D28ABF|nr:glycosyltransferase [Mucilaginibacter sp.]